MSARIINKIAMKKIMFNDRYGLTTAVLEGHKTQTRRLSGFYDQTMNPHLTLLLRSEKGREEFVALKSKYKIGEVVAIAQSYSDCAKEELQPKFKGHIYPPYHLYDDVAGWDNKMFVKADLMPHHIKITDIRVERLQDISDEDCIAEGISKVDFALKERGLYSFRYENEWYEQFQTPREAFAYLIDKICGKGTWSRNPWVFVYGFELVD